MTLRNETLTTLVTTQIERSELDFANFEFLRVYASLLQIRDALGWSVGSWTASLPCFKTSRRVVFPALSRPKKSSFPLFWYKPTQSFAVPPLRTKIVQHIIKPIDKEHCYGQRNTITGLLKAMCILSKSTRIRVSEVFWCEEGVPCILDFLSICCSCFERREEERGEWENGLGLSFRCVAGVDRDSVVRVESEMDSH